MLFYAADNMTKANPIQDNPPFHVIIAAAGNSTRMGGDIPKIYRCIGGRTVLQHSIDKFKNINGLKSITIVTHKAHHDLIPDAVHQKSNVKIVIGGNSRKESIFNALKSLSNISHDDLVLIHDAARPLVHAEDIAGLFDILRQGAPAATLVSAIQDTLIRDGEPLNRQKIRAVQTPQAFRYDLIRKAHDSFQDRDDFTDDAGMVRALGKPVAEVMAAHPNIKITTPADFAIVAAMMTMSTTVRVGSGFDVHAFEAEETDRPLMLGGIKIAHDRALTGHSDADVVLHSVTDAILGALNEGDIGTHFPPSDDQWKNADSALFLQHAAQILEKRGGGLSFIDVTVICEAPKIGQYRKSIQTRIAEILSISKDKVSIKATTTEKLGFTGRKEGIACQALVTITLPDGTAGI
jgi:2-C-methyl-D-erythritol 4-phosphate cytidylyltransferase/2-C-methyl-D-erythritol 2,4-cyclodiphosphate synthase